MTIPLLFRRLQLRHTSTSDKAQAFGRVSIFREQVTELNLHATHNTNVDPLAARYPVQRVLQLVEPLLPTLTSLRHVELFTLDISPTILDFLLTCRTLRHLHLGWCGTGAVRTPPSINTELESVIFMDVLQLALFFPLLRASAASLRSIVFPPLFRNVRPELDALKAIAKLRLLNVHTMTLRSEYHSELLRSLLLASPQLKTIYLHRIHSDLVTALPSGSLSSLETLHCSPGRALPLFPRYGLHLTSYYQLSDEGTLTATALDELCKTMAESKSVLRQIRLYINHVDLRTVVDTLLRHPVHQKCTFLELHMSFITSPAPSFGGSAPVRSPLS